MWIRTSVGIGAAAVIAAAAIALVRQPGLRPGAVGLELTLLVAVGAAARRWAIPLPGSGLTSLVPGVSLAALLWLTWPAAVLVTAAGVVVGDLVFRRVTTRQASRSAAPLTLAAGVAGLVYAGLGGQLGSAALSADNLLTVIVSAGLLAFVASWTSAFTLAPSGAGIDLRRALRWDLIVTGWSLALAIAWLSLITATTGVLTGLVFAVVLTGATGSIATALRAAIRAEQLAVVQQIAGAVAGEGGIQHGWARIEALAHSLVPWTRMSVARYLADSDALEEITAAGTAEPHRPGGGTRVSAVSGAAAEAIRLRRAVITGPEDGVGESGSEILVPLFQGDVVVGMWRIAHIEGNMYQQGHADLLTLLGPQLALSVSLSSLVQPLLESSGEAASYATQLTAAGGAARRGFSDVNAAAGRTEQRARQAAERVQAALEALTRLAAGIRETIRVAQDVQHTSKTVAENAVQVRSATIRAVQQLRQLGGTIEEGAEEVGRLREAADEVERFSETISGIAYQTNLLALNATIEAARAGLHGSGFSVVADEVRKLAEESERAARSIGRSAQETGKVIDRAARLLEDIGKQLRDLAHVSGQFTAELDTIVAAAEATRRAAEKTVAGPLENLTLAETAGSLLVDAQSTANESVGIAASVTADVAQLQQAIVELGKGAEVLSGLADRLSQSGQLVGTRRQVPAGQQAKPL